MKKIILLVCIFMTQALQANINQTIEKKNKIIEEVARKRETSISATCEKIVYTSALHISGYSAFIHALCKEMCDCNTKQNYITNSAYAAAAGLIPRGYLLYKILSTIYSKDYKTFFNKRTGTATVLTITLGATSKYFADNAEKTN
ncbi:hypothetical protein JKY79_02115 [Candidatus Babeliales bacterium]|nr:hypothetical protein [Candidatus Babeliales bacterium]